MQNTSVGIVILFCAIATVACRLFPILIFEGKSFSPRIKKFFHFSPVAILAAMIASEIVFMEGAFNLGLENKYFWMFFPTLFIALKSKNIAVTVTLAVGLLALWRWMSGGV